MSKGGSISGRTLPRLPRFERGMRIGLLGGSFDPPHEGHVTATETALRRLGLDRVWWLVSPQNPLKRAGPLLDLPRRIAAARALLPDPRVIVTGIEAELGTRYTADTIRALKRRVQGVRFVWLMGADNLGGFHRWNEWRAIARLVPIAVVDRPGATLTAMASPAAHWLAPHRLPEAEAGTIADRDPPSWVFLHGRKVAQSSTALRAAAKASPRRKTAS